MTNDSHDIEVEVVEVENSARPADRESVRRNVASGGNWREWRHWHGQVRRIDRRWWPLWVIPGIILLALAMVIGAVIGLLAVVFVICRNLIRALSR